MNATAGAERAPDAAEEVLDFWLGAGPEAWYRQDPAFDHEIRDRFEGLWMDGKAGGLDGQWLGTARGALALLVLLDQLPRNMFRGEGRAFDSDEKALSVARQALERGRDLQVDAPERQFFYMPFMHSESLPDQDTCLRLFEERLPGDNVVHARAHREIIRRFGRFPYRNGALGRATTAEEQAFLDQGGYGSVLNALGRN